MRRESERELCIDEKEQTASVLFRVVLKLIIVHSKYFPDSDWLKAHV